MRQISALTLSLLMLLTMVAQGQSDAPYESGRALQKRLGPIFAKDPKMLEVGQYFTVPVDYQDASKGTTEVYVRFMNGPGESFDLKKPTVLFFTGGPGQHIHGAPLARAIPGVNLLCLESRGIFFSRPESEALAKSASFYSSENTARDFESVRKALGIPKVSVYGVSYGTQPATIYGSLFPEVTKSVTITGIVYDGKDAAFRRSEAVLRMIEKFYRDLPGDVKIKIQEASKTESRLWFPNLVWSRISQSGNLMLKPLREEILAAAKHKVPEMIKVLTAENSDSSSLLPGIEWDMYNILSLKERGFADPETSIEFELTEDGRIVRAKNNTLPELMGKYGFRPEDVKPFRAIEYPVHVPVTYLQGSRDPNTPPIGASLHFKNVAKDNVQLLVFRGLGHSIEGGLGRVDPSEGKTQMNFYIRNILLKAILAGRVDVDAIEEFNRIGPVGVAVTQRQMCHRIF